MSKNNDNGNNDDLVGFDIGDGEIYQPKLKKYRSNYSNTTTTHGNASNASNDFLKISQKINKKKAKENKNKTDEDLNRDYEEEILKSQLLQQKKLLSYKELSKDGLIDDKGLSVFSSWKPPNYILERDQDFNNNLVQSNHIIIEGFNPPPPINSFHVCLLL